MKKIILLLISIFLLTGCYDYHELDDLNIINSIGIDYKEDEYIVYLEMVQNAKSDQGDKITTEVITAKDKVLSNAFTKAIYSSGKKDYFKQVQLLIMSKDFAERGTTDVFEYLLRDSNYSTTFYSVVTDNPKEILDITLDNDSICTYIVHSLNYNIEAQKLDNVDILASDLLNERKDIALPYITKKEDTIAIEQIAYFQKDQMKGIMDSKMYNFLLLDTLDINFEQDGVVLSIYKKDISYDVKKNKIVVQIKAMGKIEEITEDMDLQDDTIYEELETIFQQKIKEEVSSFIDSTLQDHSDLLGFKDWYYKFYRKLKDHLPYEVKVEVEVVRNGSVYEVIS